MESIVIRRAVSEADFQTAASLVEQLAYFENLTPPDDAAKARFVADGYQRSPPRFEVWLAEVEGIAAGYILIFETYSTFLCKPSLFLEDLFVLPQFRKRGLGAKLLDHCINLAKVRGCGRMEWTCLDWNVKAQSVYEKIGATRMAEWYLYRLTENALNSR